MFEYVDENLSRFCKICESLHGSVEVDFDKKNNSNAQML